MRIRLPALWLLATLVAGAPVVAHHNASVAYDTSKAIVVEGVVTRFSLGNPHIRVFFTRPDGVGGAGEEWMAEGGSRTVLQRKGFTPDMLKVGDKVTLFGSPARDDTNAMHFTEIAMPDGRKLWAEDTPPPDRVRGLIEQRQSGAAGQPPPSN